MNPSTIIFLKCSNLLIDFTFINDRRSIHLFCLMLGWQPLFIIITEKSMNRMLQFLRYITFPYIHRRYFSGVFFPSFSFLFIFFILISLFNFIPLFLGDSFFYSQNLVPQYVLSKWMHPLFLDLVTWRRDNLCMPSTQI